MASNDDNIFQFLNTNVLSEPFTNDNKSIKKTELSTNDDFIDFLSKLDNEEFIKTHIVTKNDFSVAFKIAGDKFDSSLTGTLITALAEYQENIYHIYKVQKYGAKSSKNLTPEEKRRLEIKVYIKPGCTEAVISFVKDIAVEVFKNMTGSEISKALITISAILISAWAIKGISVPLIKEAFKNKNKEIDAKVEIEKNQKKKEFLEVIKTVTSTAIEGMRSVAQGITNADPKNITMDGKILDKVLVSQIPNELKPEKNKDKDNKPDFYTVEGSFKVLELNYEKVVTVMRALHIESNILYEDITLQDDWMTPENMAILENAQSREPVCFRISCQKNGKRYTHFIDVNSIRKIGTSESG